MPRPPLVPVAALVALALLGACSTDGAPPADGPAYPLETRADSVALRALEGMGGPEAWAAMPYLRFDFGFERDGTRTVARRHLWNRHTGDYRLEWTRGDSSFVALFNVDTQEGDVYLDGARLDSAANAEALQRAYRGFINDTYWFMAPAKMFDEGVTRTYVADSSDAATDVVTLAFDGVGLTPGDRYWMYVDRETGRVNRWRFELQSGGRGDYAWTGYESHDTPAGPVHVATRKVAPNGRTVLTDAVDTPAEVPAELFTDPNPRL